MRSHAVAGGLCGSLSAITIWFSVRFCVSRPARQRRILFVNPEEKTVLDMSATMQGASGSGGVRNADARIEKIGPGPSIAGYATEHYVLSAGGAKCEDLFTSKKAFEDSGWASLWSAFGKTFEEMSTAGEQSDPCDLAQDQADPAKIGWPLKTVSSDGEVTEVLRIEADVKLPAGGFEVPPGYRVVSMQEMMSSDFDDDEEDEGED